MTEPDVAGAGPTLDDGALLRVLVREAPEAVFLARPTGELLDANPAFLALAGMPSVAEARRRRIDDVLVDPDIWARARGRLDAGEHVRDLELWLVRPDGELHLALAAFLSFPEGGPGAFVAGLLVDITRRKEFETTLREASWRDALTGCHNRRYLDDLAARLQRSGEPTWGCIYIDIDHFKQYNDEHGHHAGDEVLVRMARFLMREVRAEENVVRLGGDEFLVVMVGEAAASTERIATRLRRTAARIAPSPFSLGWAVRAPGEAFAETLDRADRELLKVRVEARGVRQRASDRE